jgi:hypothetical protein
VRPIAKPFLFFGTILFGIFLFLLLAANLTLQLPGIKDRIRTALTSALGTPILFEHILLNPAGGIRLSRIIATPTNHVTLASAEAITVYPSWENLLNGQFVPKAISLQHPVTTVKLGTSTAPKNPPPAPTLLVPMSLTGQPQGTKSAPLTKPTALLGGLLISHGELSVLDAGSHPVLHLNDVATRAERGVLQITAATAIINDSLIFHQLAADAEADAEETSLSLQNISATMGEGRITGTLRCGLPPSSPIYTATLQLNGAKLSKLLADASLGSPSAEGQIDGDLTITGTAGSGATMTGKGSLRCKEAIIEPVAFLKQIGQLLNVDELKLLKLAEGKCRFRIDGGHVVIDELFLRSENLILSAKGPVQNSGELDLESRLLFNQTLTGRLHGLLGSQLRPAPEPGYSQVTFHVSGPAFNPRTDLIERLTGIHLGGNLGGLGGLLQGLFGKPAPQSLPPPTQPQAPSQVPAH